MGGVIRADRPKVCDCGGKFTQVNDREYTHPVPRCAACNQRPKSLYVRLTLPALGKVDIRYNKAGTRLSTLALCDAFLTDTHDAIAKGTFDPLDYGGPKSRSALNASAWLLNWVARKEKRIGTIGASPATVTDTQGLVGNYLLPYFGPLDLTDIKYHHMLGFLEEDAEFFRSKIEGEKRRKRFRGGGIHMRHAALSLLRLIMQEASKSYPQIIVPPLPEKATKGNPRRKLMKLDDRERVIRHVKNHRAFFTALAAYTVRPSDMRSLKWGDLDFKRQTVTFQSHFSRDTELPGRKSHQDMSDPFATLELAFNDMFRSALKQVERKLDPGAYVFVTRNDTPLSHPIILTQWRRACERAGVEYVPPYRATKHTNLSNLARSHSPEVLLAISGNRNRAVVDKHYVQRDTVEISRGMDEQ